VVIDQSESMTLGGPPKWPPALKLAAALAFMGLGAMDRVQVGTWDPAGPHSQPQRGRDGMGRVLAFLATPSPSAEAEPAQLPRPPPPRGTCRPTACPTARRRRSTTPRAPGSILRRSPAG